MAGGGLERLSQGVALVPRPEARLVRVGGRDAVDFLHRMLSQDVAGLSPGEAAYACVLERTGRILGDPWVWRCEDGVWLGLDAEAAAVAVPHLERHVIADDVTFEMQGSGALFLLGAGLPALCAAAGWPDLDAGRHAEISLAGSDAPVRLLRRQLGDVPLLEVHAAPAELDALAERCVEYSAAEGLAVEDYDALRVQELVPMFGPELGDDVMPLEAGLGDSAISWTKGCYPGQEPVVMARHRGKPPHALVRMVLEPTGGARPEPGALQDSQGRAVGRVTTVTDRLEGVQALAYVRTALAEAGATFAHEDGARATIAAIAGDPR